MNHLLIDMGNQRLKWASVALCSNQSSKAVVSLIALDQGAIEYDQDSTLFDGGQHTENIGNDTEPHWPYPLPDSLDNPERILLSSVSNKVASRALGNYCQQRWGLQPDYVASEAVKLGLSNGYLNPSQLGCDRWLAAIAGYQLICREGGRSSVVIVDAGTAITVDLVADHCFKGGAILPGFATIVRVMGSSTGKIKLDIPTVVDEILAQGNIQDLFNYNFVLANNSAEAVRAGALVSVAGGIDRCLDQIESGFEEPVEILLTGGDAELVSALLVHNCAIIPNLVLIGLALVAQDELI